MSFGWVYVVVDLDGEEHRVAAELFDMGDGDPEKLARPALEAWEAARDKTERTLRLFGAEGVIRAMQTGDSSPASERDA